MASAINKVILIFVNHVIHGQLQSLIDTAYITSTLTPSVQHSHLLLSIHSLLQMKSILLHFEPQKCVVFRISGESSPECDDICPSRVAQSVFRDLIFRVSFGKINDVVRPVIR